MCNALGIVNFPGGNVQVRGMEEYRPIGAFSFLGRYRMLDFPISNLTNSGIEQIQVHIKKKPRSIIEHLGTGRQYNINSKRGGLQILYGERLPESEFYNHDIASFSANLAYIEEANFEYVMIVPSYMVYVMDYNKLLAEHIESGADVTIAYKSIDEAKTKFVNCDTLNLNKQKGVLSIDKNRGNYKTRNISMETYVLRKELFIELIEKAVKTSSLFWFRDILNDQCSELDIRGSSFRGYLAAITDLNSYYEANMALIDVPTSRQLFEENWPIYTRTNDSAPTHYTATSKVSRSVISNGCKIEGSVENSVIGRGCTIKKGAIVRNSVVLPGCYIGEDVILDNVVVDKKAKITRMKEVVGICGSPAYVRRGDKI